MFGLRRLGLLCSYEQSTSIKMFFVIGHTTDVEAETAVAQEATEHGGFMRLPIQARYASDLAVVT